MRVAYICADPGLPVFGRKGGSVHVQEVIRGLRRLGHQVELLATRLGGEPPADLAGLAVTALPAIGRGSPATREAAGRQANRGLSAALDAVGPVDLVYERYSLWSHAGMAWARRTGTPAVLEVNAPLIDEQAEHRSLVGRQEAEACARAAFEDATAVVAVSEPVADWVRARTPAPERVHVVGNGVDPERIVARPRVDHPNHFTIGFVGTLKPWHGLETLVDAFALLAGADFTYRLLVVGDGPGAGGLADSLERRGLTSMITLAGAVDPAAIPEYLHGMDLAVAPYPDLPHFYFSPLKLYEYLAAGLPVVASEVGQVAEVIDDGRTGVLCPPGDAAALARAIAGLRYNPAGRASMASAGRAEVVAHHSWDEVVGRILRLVRAAPAQAA
ncbi:glycosyltransferase family 4 protein [soil metagenome]